MNINPKLQNALEWIMCIIIALVISMLVRYYVGTPTIVESVSMNPTLVEGQRLWINRLGRITNKMPKRGDIITFEAPTKIVNISENNIDLNNAIAKYENEPDGLWEKFLYYVVEVGKISYIKRVIALPGEHVEIKEGHVFINGQKLEEDYLVDGIVTDMARGYYNDFVVPEGTVFALGDNRTQSTDCRVFGCIPVKKIESKLSFRFWPLNLFGKV